MKFAVAALLATVSAQECDFKDKNAAQCFFKQFQNEGVMKREQFDAFMNYEMEYMKKEGKTEDMGDFSEDAQKKMRDAVWMMGAEMGGEMDEKMFYKLWNWYTSDPMKAQMGNDGKWDMEQMFRDVDYNGNGFMDALELGNHDQKPRHGDRKATHRGTIPRSQPKNDEDGQGPKDGTRPERIRSLHDVLRQGRW